MENTLRCNCNFDIKGIYGLKKNFAKILLIFSGLLYLIGLVFEFKILPYSIDKTFLSFVFIFCYFDLGCGN